MWILYLKKYYIFNIEWVFYIYFHTYTTVQKVWFGKKTKTNVFVFYAHQGCTYLKLFIIIKYLNELK